jgi:hypothetical protein
MNQIRSLLKMAARRLEATSFIAAAHLAAVILALLALLLVVVDRLGQPFVPWRWVIPGLVIIALAVAAARWSRRRLSELQVALAVDDRLQLDEKLSTALHCEGRDDPFAQAALEDAVGVASKPSTRELTRRTLAVRAPAGWWLSPLLALAALMLSLLSPLDLFNREIEDDQSPDLVEARHAADQTVEAVVQAIEDRPELSRELADLLGDLASDSAEPGDAMRPEEVRRDAIKKVSEINKRLEDLMSGEKGKTADALERALSQLKTPQDGEGRELADALAKGDFKGAQQALENLMEKLQNGQMNAEQQEQLAKQLEALAKQLEALAKQQQQLEQALQQAGLDPQLAQNPQALQQALQNNPNLNQQQMQQLQQMAQAQQAAAQMCQGLGQACQQMAQGMGQGQMGQMGQGAQQMADQLNQMEQLQMMLDQAQAAANACQGQCQGLGQGLALKPGGAFGKRGQGAGGRAPLAPTPYGNRKVKANIKTDAETDIIARMLIEGPQIVGESRKPARQMIAELIESFDDAQAEENLPRKYNEAIMHYFGELRELTEAMEPAAAGPAEEPPAPGP